MIALIIAAILCVLCTITTACLLYKLRLEKSDLAALHIAINDALDELVDVVGPDAAFQMIFYSDMLDE